MDKISKFLSLLSMKQKRFLIDEVLVKINSLELADLDVKPLRGMKNLYRVRIGKVRAVFFKDTKNKKGVIIKIGFRKDIYKEL